MRHNTRFNPTITGPLHIGHLYMALVNEFEAHRTGGKFYVRVDDTQPHWSFKIGKKRREKYYLEYREQLDLFLSIDGWHRQSQMPKPKDIIGKHPILKRYPRLFENGVDVEYQERFGRSLNGYNPEYIVRKIVWDFYEKTNWLIRGEELMAEANLYSHFVEEIGLPRVYQIYLPHLERKESGERVSKSAGTYGLAKQIDAFGIEGTLSRLRESCLVDLEGEFVIDNIKRQPIVQGFIK